MQLTNFATPALIYDGQEGLEASLGKWMICRRREALQIQVKAIGKEEGDNKWTRVCCVVSSRYIPVLVCLVLISGQYYSNETWNGLSPERELQGRCCEVIEKREW